MNRVYPLHIILLYNVAVTYFGRESRPSLCGPRSNCSSGPCCCDGGDDDDGCHGDSADGADCAAGTWASHPGDARLMPRLPLPSSLNCQTLG